MSDDDDGNGDNEKDSGWGCVEPTGDLSNLDGESIDSIFIHGVEWEMFRQLIRAGGPMSRTVHAKNLDRLVAMARRHGREVKVEWPKDDASEDWVFIEVAGDGEEDE